VKNRYNQRSQGALARGLSVFVSDEVSSLCSQPEKDLSEM